MEERQSPCDFHDLVTKMSLVLVSSFQIEEARMGKANDMMKKMGRREQFLMPLFITPLMGIADVGMPNA